MSVWLVWLVAAGVLGSAEALSGDFVLIMCGAGAGAAAVTAAVGAPPAVQIVVAVAVGLGLVGFLRLVAKRHLLVGCGYQSGSAALVGEPAMVLVEVDDRDGRGGNLSRWGRGAGDADRRCHGRGVRRVVFEL